MRRKSKEKRRYSSIQDIKRDVPAEVLAGIGAVALAWNELEAGIEFLLAQTLELSSGMTLEVTSRINGFDGKIAIIKAALREVWGFPDEVLRLIADTFGAVEEYKRYRDGVEHALIVNKVSMVAQIVQRRGVLDDVLVSEDALNALYERLVAVDQEVFLLLKAIMMLHLPEMGRRKFKLGEVSASMQESAERGAAEYLLQLLDLQQKRKALRKLPEFPDPPQDHQDLEGGSRPHS